MLRPLKRPLLLGALAVLLGASGYLGYELVLLKQEAQAFEAGEYEAAARYAGPVRLLKGQLAAQLQRQAGELEARGVGAKELPLLQLTGDLTGNEALRERLSGLKLLLAEPKALAVAEVEVHMEDATPEPEPEETNEFFRQELIGAEESAWGARYALLRKDGSGAWKAFEEGFSGPMGGSFELTQEGRHVVVGRPDAIELWDLLRGEPRRFEVEGPPEFVSLAPAGDSLRIAYSIAGEEGDRLHLIEGGQSRALYPPAGEAPLPWLSFSWAPDGESLVLKWEESAEGEKPVTQVVWLRATGERVLEATLGHAIQDVDLTWAPSPDGKRMMLGLAGAHWLWEQGAAGAKPVLGVDGVWGWSPDSRKIAGVAWGAVYVLNVEDPGDRLEQSFPNLPLALAGEPKDVRWVGDTISLVGVTGEAEALKEARIAIRLALKSSP